jgi:hypothetical protein
METTILLVRGTSKRARITAHIIKRSDVSAIMSILLVG